LGDDEAYNVYDQAWNSSTAVASQIYKPTKTTKDNFEDTEALINASKRFVLFSFVKNFLILFNLILVSSKNVASKELIEQHHVMVLFNFNGKKIHLV
jgi:hypothetical protein